MHNQDVNRPALRPVRAAEMPAGRKVLMPRWWMTDFDDGTTLLAREQHRQRRAARPPKHAPDLVTQKAARSFAVWSFVNEPDALGWPSLALH